MKPHRVHVKLAKLSKKALRCPECKVAFVEDEEAVHDLGQPWYFHPACKIARNKRYLEAEHKRKESSWKARGRVIRKGDSL